MIKDFMEGGIGMDVCAVCVGFVYDLSSEVSKYYKRVIFWRWGMFRMAVVMEKSCGYRE